VLSCSGREVVRIAKEQGFKPFHRFNEVIRAELTLRLRNGRKRFR
jgi:hypothetical protein